jgi:hypothetical protein
MCWSSEGKVSSLEGPSFFLHKLAMRRDFVGLDGFSCGFSMSWHFRLFDRVVLVPALSAFGADWRIVILSLIAKGVVRVADVDDGWQGYFDGFIN